MPGRRTFLHLCCGGKALVSATANFLVEAANNKPRAGGQQHGLYFDTAHFIQCRRAA